MDYMEGRRSEQVEHLQVGRNGYKLVVSSFNLQNHDLTYLPHYRSPSYINPFLSRFLCVIDRANTFPLHSCVLYFHSEWPKVLLIPINSQPHSS
jgi:hypothetical protein